MSEDKKTDKWYLRPIAVILLLFLVLGPLGLPLLFKSPHFNKASRIILTILTCIYTIYLIYVSVEIIRELLKRIEEIQELLR
jgi:hypothetical protein